jgi:tRNA (mo5U34)-methyltransferase
VGKNAWDPSAAPDQRQRGDASITSEELATFLWWHSIRLNDGRVTPGRKSLELMDQECARTFGPIDLVGKSVLDVGAWNGGFSIEAARRGAGRVVALDHATWKNPMFRGRTGFEIAKRLCNVSIEAIDQDIDVPQLDLAHLGTFDIVLFLGVFYHLLDPLAALREISRLAREVLVVETHVEETADPRPTMIFYPGDDLNGDSSNWWGPNRRCVEDLLRLNGFGRIEYAAGSSSTRGIFHAFRS